MTNALVNATENVANPVQIVYVPVNNDLLLEKEKIIYQQTKTISELMKTVQYKNEKNSVVEILSSVAAAAGAIFAIYSLFK